MRALKIISFGCWAILGVLLGTMGYGVTNWQMWAIMVLMGTVGVIAHHEGLTAGVEIGQSYPASE